MKCPFCSTELIVLNNLGKKTYPSNSGDLYCDSKLITWRIYSFPHYILNHEQGEVIFFITHYRIYYQKRLLYINDDVIQDNDRVLCDRLLANPTEETLDKILSMYKVFK